MPRYDMYMAAREAIEEAYKEGLVSRRYVPVTRENLFDKLAAYQPLDSEEYRALEEAVVKDFRARPGTHRRPAEVAEIPRSDDSDGHHAPLRLRLSESCEPPTRAGDEYVSVLRDRRGGGHPIRVRPKHPARPGEGRAHQDGARRAAAAWCCNGDPADVTMLDVLEAIQGPVSVSLCAMRPGLLPKARRTAPTTRSGTAPTAC